MPFPHERLNVYRQAVEFLTLIVPLLDDLPAGYSRLRDQLRRAAWSIALNIAERAGRRTKDDKCRFFSIARGSCYECAAILDAWAAVTPRSRAQAQAAKVPLEEIARMLSGLIRL